MMETMSTQDPDTTYNGWANRETWLANLWIGNEEWSDSEARELVERRMADDVAYPIVAAAESLRYWAEEMFLDPATEQVDLAGFVTDLLNAAWARIDWREIAEGMLEQ